MKFRYIKCPHCGCTNKEDIEQEIGLCNVCLNSFNPKEEQKKKTKEELDLEYGEDIKERIRYSGIDLYTYLEYFECTPTSNCPEEVK